MKKLIFILILTFLFPLSSVYADSKIEHEQHLLSYKDYKNITPDNIKSLKIIRYTEGGADETPVNNKDEITLIYNFLNKIKITDETKMSCTDNTTLYSFTLKDNSKTTVEIECNWVVIKNRNYLFKLQ